MARPIILIVLLIALGCVVVVQIPKVLNYLEQQEQLKPPPPIKTLPMISRMEEGLSIQESLDAAYRLSPDERFLLAAGNIHAILTNEMPITVDAQWTDGQWTLIHGTDVIGTLPEIPSYTDWNSLLSDWTNSNLAKHPFTWAEPTNDYDRIAELFLAPYCLSTLKEINVKWTTQNASKLDIVAAAKSAIHLYWQTLDTLELSDPIAGQAIALAHIAENSGATDFSDEKALLSYKLGYTRHAHEVASELELDSDVRAYILRDGPSLERISSRGLTTSRSRYLYAAYLSRDTYNNVTSDAFREWLFGEYSQLLLDPGVVALLVHNRYAEYTGHLTPYIPELAKHYLRMDAQGADAPTISRTRIRNSDRSLEDVVSVALDRILGIGERQFVSDLNSLSAQYTGPIMPVSVAQRYYESMFYSGQYELGKRFLGWTHNPEVSEEYGEYISKNSGPIGRELAKWYSNQVALKFRNGPARQVIIALEDLNYIGHPVIYTSFWELGDQLNWLDPKLVRTAKVIIGQLDTRPDHIKTVAEMLHLRIHDLKRSRHYYASHWPLIASVPDCPTIAISDADFETLLRIARSNRYDIEDRSNAVTRAYTTSGKEPSNDIELIYQFLTTQFPKTWTTHRDFANYLVDRNRYNDAKKLLLRYASRMRGTEFFLRKNAYDQLATIALEFDDAESAWRFVENRLDSAHPSTLWIAVDIMRMQGKKRDSIQLGEDFIDKHPRNIDAYASLAKALWHFEEYDRAAKVFRDPRLRLSNAHWAFTIDEAFFDVFADAPIEQAIMAYDALIQEEYEPYELMYLAGHLSKHQHFEKAFTLISRLPNKDNEFHNFTGMGYKYLVALNRSDEGIEWAKERDTRRAGLNAALRFYDSKAFPLLWHVYDDPSQIQYGDYLWLLRAAGFVHPSNKNPEFEDELRQYYTQEAGDGKYDTLGKFLLGLVPQSDVYAWIGDAETLSECGYFIALSYHAKGDYESASDWYRLSVESESQADWETKWATAALTNWHDHAKSLAYARRLGL